MVDESLSADDENVFNVYYRRSRSISKESEPGGPSFQN